MLLSKLWNQKAQNNPVSVHQNVDNSSSCVSPSSVEIAQLDYSILWTVFTKPKNQILLPFAFLLWNKVIAKQLMNISNRKPRKILTKKGQVKKAMQFYKWQRGSSKECLHFVTKNLYCFYWALLGNLLF